ncbi:MAG: hypothetical protein KAG20_06375 [Cocleimonas sp.]|nr:hypothetical protein [Cocleimonas sp.]
MSWGDSLNVAYNIATDAYQTVKKKFTTAYATASTFVCDTAPLAAENFAYQELAGRVTSWGGSAANTFFPEEVKVAFSDENFAQWTGGLSIAETQILYKSATGKEIPRTTIETLFTDPEKAREILINDKDIHTVYRDLLNRNTPDSLTALENNPEWAELSTGKSVFHASLTRGNRKFISNDGYREVIIAPDGSVDNRNEFKGTFNFFSPNDYPGSHITADVDPYVKHGN